MLCTASFVFCCVVCLGRLFRRPLKRRSYADRRADVHFCVFRGLRLFGSCDFPFGEKNPRPPNPASLNPPIYFSRCLLSLCFFVFVFVFFPPSPRVCVVCVLCVYVLPSFRSGRPVGCALLGASPLSRTARLCSSAGHSSVQVRAPGGLRVLVRARRGGLRRGLSHGSSRGGAGVSALTAVCLSVAYTYVA